MGHVVVYIPGLADKQPIYLIGQRLPIKSWRAWYGIRTRYFKVGWADTHEDFAAKKQRLLHMIDTQVAQGHTVSIVAASAGASLGVVALKEHGKVHRLVSICGKLKNPQTVSPALYALNPAFKASMEAFQKIEPTLNATERSRILHVQPRQDSLVPVGDNYIDGAHTTRIPTSGHVFSIVCALTFFSKRIIDFVRTPN